MMPSRTMRLRGMFCGNSMPAQNILLLRNRFEVRGIDAIAIAAEVINDEPLRNWSREQFIGKAMGINNLVPASESGVQMLLVRLPRPALVGASTIYPCPETLLNCSPHKEKPYC